MITFGRKTIIGFVLAGLVLAGLLYLLYANGFIEYFTDRRRLLNLINAHRAYAALIFIGLQALQVVAAPVPGEVSGFVGGVFFGTARGILYSTVGLTLGSWMAFMLARLAGRPLVELVVKTETIKRYDYVMKHKGMFLAFLMFLIPGFPKDILCYLLGLGHMGQRDFLIVSTSGRLLGTVLLTLGGAFFRHRRYGALFTLAGVCIFIILLAMIYRETIERWFRSMRAAQLIKHRARSRAKKDR
ncbi:MAG TPA: VTT domain-containing protein [Nitrospirota bacterium]|nr:VTT domain-containing protein [Nitrospirota bacterium]